MQSFAPAAPWLQAACKLINDDDFSVFDHVLLVTIKERLGAHCRLEVVRDLLDAVGSRAGTARAVALNDYRADLPVDEDAPGNEPKPAAADAAPPTLKAVRPVVQSGRAAAFSPAYFSDQVKWLVVPSSNSASIFPTDAICSQVVGTLPSISS